MVSRIKDRKGNDPCLAFTAPTRIPEEALFPGTFAFGNLAWFASLSLFIQETIILGPAQNETSPLHKDLRQPGGACKAAIPDMEHFFAPQSIDLSQNRTFFRPFQARLLTPRRPPVQVRKRWAVFVPHH